MSRQARRDGMAVQSSMVSESSSSTAYYHRELLILTPEGRRVDLLTVTDCHGILVSAHSTDVLEGKGFSATVALISGILT